MTVRPAPKPAVKMIVVAEKLAATIVVAVTIAVTTLAVVHIRYVVPSPVVMPRPVATVSVAVTSVAMAFAVVQGRYVVTAPVVIPTIAVMTKYVAVRAKNVVQIQVLIAVDPMKLVVMGIVVTLILRYVVMMGVNPDVRTQTQQVLVIPAITRTMNASDVRSYRFFVTILPQGFTQATKIMDAPEVVPAIVPHSLTFYVTQSICVKRILHSTVLFAAQQEKG